MQRSNRRTKSFLTSVQRAIALAVALSACAAPAPRVVEVTKEEQARRERERGAQMAQSVEIRLSFKQDAVLLSELERLATALGQKSGAQIRIFIPTESAPGPVFVLPGERWYFSSTALKELRFDNELAALVAAALALSELRVPGSENDSTLVSENEWRAANRRMVALLYAAGFDPRGVPNFWRKTRGLKILEEEAHSEIARRAPLLNPVVRTPRFGEIKKRLRRL